MPEGVEEFFPDRCPNLKTVKLPSTVSALFLEDCPRLVFVLNLPKNLRSIRVVNCPLLQLAHEGVLAYAHISQSPGVNITHIPGFETLLRAIQPGYRFQSAEPVTALELTSHRLIVQKCSKLPAIPSKCEISLRVIDCDMKNLVVPWQVFDLEVFGCKELEMIVREASPACAYNENSGRPCKNPTCKDCVHLVAVRAEDCPLLQSSVESEGFKNIIKNCHNSS